MSLDNFNNGARDVILMGLGEIPEVGGLLSHLVGMLWPQQEDVWDEIKAQVEQLVAQMISKANYQLVQEDLSGLEAELKNFQDDLNQTPIDYEEVRGEFRDLSNDFSHDAPHFKAEGSGDEFLLLPLFAQFANLHLALMRQGVGSAATWGMVPADADTFAKELTGLVADYVSWAQQQSAIYVTEAQVTMDVLNVAPDPAKRVPASWNRANNIVRQTTFNVLDYAHYWPYFDPSQAGATPQPPPPARTVYTDALGTFANSPFALPKTPPAAMITRVEVWGADYVRAIRLHYGGTAGPVMGDTSVQDGAYGPKGGTFEVSPDNPLAAVWGRSGDILNGLGFTFKDGTQTALFGYGYTHDAQGNPVGNEFAYQYDGEILSDIKVMGMSAFYSSADCVVFGFRYPGSYAGS